MKNLLFVAAVLAFASQACVASESTDDAQGFDIVEQRSTMIPMRDDVLLSTDLFFPGGASEKLPVVLVSTMYGKNQHFDNDVMLQSLVQRGYVVAVQDVRGRFESEGRYEYASGRREDAFDTIEWLVAQPWSNNKVATAGCSYHGEMQVITAATQHPSLVTALPMAAGSGYYSPGRGLAAFNGGAFELAQTAGWFATTGSKVAYGPPEWVDRQEWFRSDAAKAFRPYPAVDFAAFVKTYDTLPTISLLQRAGTPPTDYENYLLNLPDSDYFRSRDWVDASDQFNVPALFIDSWYDYGASESFKLFELFQENNSSEQARENQFIIIAPSTHCGYGNATENTVIGERELGDARLGFLDIQLRWYDYWVKGVENGVTDMPKVQYYLMGKNEWRSSDVWPLKNMQQQKWLLQSDDNANSSNGDGLLSLQLAKAASVDAITYDPADPVPSLGGHTCCTGTDTEAGGYDQSAIELRDDVLVYTSPVLEDGIEVTGPIEVVLQVSSSAVDTDFTAKLVDVYPDGRAFNIQEGILRMRYREGVHQQVFMDPGQIYEIRLDLHVTSNYFGEGHRIRLEVSSSNFPRFDRNLNTGGNNYDETEWKKAENKLHLSADAPSYILLPVVE